MKRLFEQIILLFLFQYLVGFSLSADVPVDIQNKGRKLQSLLDAQTIVNELAKGNTLSVNQNSSFLSHKSDVDAAELEAKIDQLGVDLISAANFEKEFKASTSSLQRLSFWVNNKFQYATHFVPTAIDYFRVNGPILGAGLIAGVGMEIGSDALAVKVHQKLLKVFIIAFPFEVIPSAIAFKINSSVKTWRLYTYYGGKKNFNKLIKKFSEARRELGLKKNADILVSISQLTESETPKAIVVPNSNFLIQRFNRFGLFGNHLTARNLIEFLETQGINNPIVAATRSSLAKKLPENVRIFLLLNIIRKSDDASLIHQFRQKFNVTVVELPPLNQMTGVRKWLSRLHASASKTDLQNLFDSVPSDLTAETIARLWYKVGIPTIKTNIPTLSRAQIRSLEGDFFPILTAATYSDSGSPWSEIWASKFRTYIGKAFDASTNKKLKRNCVKDLAKIGSGS